MGAGSWRWSRPGLQPARRGCQLKPLPFPRGGAGPALRPCAKKWALLEGAAWPLAPGTYGLLWYCMGQQPPGGARAAGWGQGMDGPGGSAELGVLPPGSAPQLIEVGTAPERHRDFPRVAQAGQAGPGCHPRSIDTPLLGLLGLADTVGLNVPPRGPREGGAKEAPQPWGGCGYSVLLSRGQQAAKWLQPLPVWGNLGEPQRYPGVVLRAASLQHHGEEQGGGCDPAFMCRPPGRLPEGAEGEASSQVPW